MGNRTKSGTAIRCDDLLASITPNAPAPGVVSFLADATTELVDPLLPVLLLRCLDPGRTTDAGP